jgi:hypothetical protein
VAGDFGDRLQCLGENGGLAISEHLCNPTTDAASVQFDAHHGADLDLWRYFFGNEVVKALVEPGDVRENPSDPYSHVVPIKPRQQP